MSLFELTEEFSTLSPSEQQVVLNNYEQATHDWVVVRLPNGTVAGFVWQDNLPPRYVVRKQDVIEKLAEVNAAIDELGFSTQAELEAMFEQDKIDLGYDMAVREYKRRKTTAAILLDERKQLKAFIARLKDD